MTQTKPPTHPDASANSSQPIAMTHEGESLLFPQLPYTMDDRVKTFVKDDEVTSAVMHATLSKDLKRKFEFGRIFGDRYDELRQMGSDIKTHTLQNLDYYLDQFVTNAEAAGVHVHFAADAQQANAICLEIAKSEQLTACVKSKSMVTEETHLVPELEAIGVETLETDLGEFILQIDGDAPSHIVTPMIHKDRFAVARAFTREIGAEYTEDPEALTKIARDYLRDKFRKADFGISGGNFLVADQGSLVLCTNEGNGRMCTSVPRVHVAMVGIEKLIPSYEHLSVMLKLLARSSTGQGLTVYTHVLTGPKREEEHDGPEKMHVIIIDNGRTGILAQDEMRQTLKCIRCGACLNACPVYRKVGGHSYGAVYSGPIGALITPLFKGLKNYKDLPNASSLCGACYEACPVKINIPEVLITLRQKMVEQKISGPVERLTYSLYAESLKHGELYRIAQWMQKKVLRFQAGNKGFIKNAPGPAKGWTAQRDLPAPAKHNFREWWAKREKGGQ